MTRVSIDQWRGNIGVFHRKKIATKSLSESGNLSFSAKKYVYNPFSFLSKPIELMFNLLVLFSYCTMIVILFPIFLMTHVFIVFYSFNDICTHPSQSYFSLLKPFQIFLGIQILPKAISLIISSTCSFFFKLPNQTKNFLFFIFVLQVLLLVSGTVEVNPGPTKSNLTFAVWNLDSLPARNYARIPLIESFQASYDFDLFGICESSLTEDILDENIVIDGFLIIPFVRTNHFLSGMEAFAFFIRKMYQFLKELIRKCYLKL